MKVYILETYSSDGYDDWGRTLGVYSSRESAALEALRQEKDFYKLSGEDGDTFHYNIYERGVK